MGGIRVSKLADESGGDFKGLGGFEEEVDESDGDPKEFSGYFGVLWGEIGY